MKRATSLKKSFIALRLSLAILITTVTGITLLSFTIKKTGDDFLKQLGITKPEADEKITMSLLGGSLDAYGLKNAKNIITGNKTAVTKDLLNYTKKYVSTPAFSKEYNALRESHKPVENKLQTPEEMQQSTVSQYKKMVQELENTIKSADASLKPIFEKSLADGKKLLREAEDPNNKSITSYRRNYEQAVKDTRRGYEKQLMDWEREYPSNSLLFIRKRLEEFLDETKDIDFTAGLTEKKGKMIFVDPAYERKSSRWKMAFRAGKEVVEPARAFVQQWMSEIQ